MVLRTAHHFCPATGTAASRAPAPKAVALFGANFFMLSALVRQSGGSRAAEWEKALVGVAREKRPGAGLTRRGLHAGGLNLLILNEAY